MKEEQPIKNETQKKEARMLTGKVVSSKMKDTIVVSVDRFVKHSKYGKYITKSKRFKAHDAGNTCREGDVVFIKESRPISKDKHFVLAGVKTKFQGELEEVAVEATE